MDDENCPLCGWIPLYEGHKTRCPQPQINEINELTKRIDILEDIIEKLTGIPMVIEP